MPAVGRHFKRLHGLKIIMKRLLIFAVLFISVTTYGQTSLTKDERLKEVEIIRASWTALHPGLLRYNTQAQIDQHFETLKNQISKPISNQQYFILLSQLATKVKCGHTYLNPWNQTEETTTTFFSNSYIPFLYRVIDRKFIITHNLSKQTNIKAGDEIISINGIKVKRIIDSLLTVSRSDGKNGLAKMLDNLNIVPIDIDTTNFALFDIYFPMFFSTNMKQSRYDFEIKPINKSSYKFSTESLTKAQRQERYVSKFGEIPIHEKNWEFKMLKPKVAYLRLGDFETWEWKADYKKYLDSVFAIIINAKANNLIIDIRGNEGGDDDARTEVLSYIANKPFGCENPMKRLYKFLSIPDTLLPYLKTWNKEFKEPKKENDYLKFNGYYEKIDTANLPCEPTNPKSNNYKGKVFLITNANNSSTTFTMADIFKNYNFGKIVGEPTGGTKQGLNGGQFFFLRLPFSKFEIDLPIIYGAPTKSRPDEAIIPDYLITTKQSDIYFNRDTQIEFILKQIEE